MFQFEEGMNVFSGNTKNQIIIYNLLYCIYYVGCRLGKSELKSDKFHYFDYFGFSRFASLNYRNLCFQIQKNSKINFWETSAPDQISIISNKSTLQYS